jgi:hypothetical protein
LSIVFFALKKIAKRKKLFCSAEFIFSTIRKYTKKQDQSVLKIIQGGDGVSKQLFVRELSNTEALNNNNL